MASTKIILKLDKIDQTGHAPLYLRVIKDRKTKFISLGIKLKENEWDAEKQRVKKIHKNSTRLNASIANKIAETEGHIADLERTVKHFSANTLKDTIQGKNIPNFFEYATNLFNNRKGSVSFNTYKNYSNGLNKFERWVGHRNLCFDQIDLTMINNYIAYMSNILKNKNGTIIVSLSALVYSFETAMDEEKIPYGMTPFNKVKIKKDPSTRQFLKKEQLKQLEQLELKGNEEFARDVFLFSAYAGGLRFSDVIELKCSNFDYTERRISKVISKTSREHQFKIGATAFEILKKYMKSEANPDDFIFPFGITNQDLYFSDGRYRRNFIENKLKIVNKCLRTIEKKLNLTFQLTFHVSRHSFATMALNNGMRIEHVSKLLDHTDIKTTQIYAKIINKELDKAVDEFLS
jgi:site-specific recombinase XerD